MGPSRDDGSIAYRTEAIAYAQPWGVACTSTGPKHAHDSGNLPLDPGQRCAGASLLPDRSSTWSLYASTAVKLPTADADKGLGTGETGLGAFLSMRRSLGGLNLGLQGGYIKSGLDDSAGLRDVFLYGAQLSGAVHRARWYASLDGRTPLVHGARAPLEIGAGGLYALRGAYFLKGSAFIGLNEGGPATGLGLGLVRVF